MTNPATASIINEALISLSRSFLQYVSESWPWVDAEDQGIADQVQTLAARQRQDVGDLVQLLIQRDWAIDFGTFPTEYTDLHFISLSTMLTWLQNGQSRIADRMASAVQTLREASDDEAVGLLEAVAMRQADLGTAMKELQQELTESAAQA